MENKVQAIDRLVRAMPPITLEEMAAIRLMKRTDQKYLTNMDTLLRLLKLTETCYFSQNVNGNRISSYATTYWDDKNAGMYRMHQTGRRPRQKVRVRTYMDSNLSFLEIKNKDNHDKTFKCRVPVPSLDAVIKGGAGQDFLTEKTGLTFKDIAPAVGNRFKRITLVNFGKTERLTIDFDIRFYNYVTGKEATMGNIVVIELKRDGRVPSPILPLLRSLRIKPSGFSKYCMGATVTNPNLRINRFKKKLVKIRKVAEKKPLRD